jgi:hypothetical protein
VDGGNNRNHDHVPAVDGKPKEEKKENGQPVQQ